MTELKVFPIISQEEKKFDTERSCGTCTACCTYTSKTINDEFFEFGQSCKYLTDKCSIYETRPNNPCKMFRCTWLHSPHIVPDWMIPYDSNVILVNRPGYLAAIICDVNKDYDPAVEWIIDFSKATNCNISIIFEKDTVLSYGNPEWVETQKKLAKEKNGIDRTDI